MAGRLVSRFMRGMEVGPMLHVLTQWPRVAGPLVSAHLQAVRFANGTLFVRAEQSVWSHQLTFLRQDLLRKYEEVLGKPVVQDIRLTTAQPAAPGLAAPAPSSPSRGAPMAPAPGTADRAPRFAELTEAELAEIETRASRHIKDPELARRWAKLEARMRSAQLARKLAGEKTCEKCGVRHPGKGPLCPVCDIEAKPPIVPGLPPLDEPPADGWASRRVRRPRSEP